jgi:4'-phosphopantetheinyl transferase
MQYLPEERKAKALRYRREIDRKLSVASYLLLIYALRKEFALSTPTLAYTAKGKPYLPDHPDIHLNLSHCPRGCVCAVSDQPVGVDIQDIRPFSQELANYCCSDGELLLLKHSEDPAACFAQMWTRKESYLKMTGEGITKRLSLVDTTGTYQTVPTVYANGCYIAVSCARFFEVP